MESNLCNFDFMISVKCLFGKNFIFDLIEVTAKSYEHLLNFALQ